jgi:hypothetical protein
MKEKIILSVVAALLGLLVAGGAFYIYQMTRTIEDKPVKMDKPLTKQQPSPTPQSNNYIIVENPKDEEVFTKKVITVSGKVTPGSTVVISTESSDQVVKPADSGNFSLTQTLEDGVSIINITAFFPNGETQSIMKTATYSSEDF